MVRRVLKLIILPRTEEKLLVAVAAFDRRRHDARFASQGF